MLFPVIMWSWLHAMRDANEASQKEGERRKETEDEHLLTPR